MRHAVMPGQAGALKALLRVVWPHGVFGSLKRRRAETVVTANGG
jgi:hypothetical protein